MCLLLVSCVVAFRFEMAQFTYIENGPWIEQAITKQINFTCSSCIMRQDFIFIFNVVLHTCTLVRLEKNIYIIKIIKHPLDLKLKYKHLSIYKFLLLRALLSREINCFVFLQILFFWRTDQRWQSSLLYTSILYIWFYE